MATTPNLDSPRPSDTEGPAGDSPSVARAERAPRWRRVLVALLVVLGCVLAPLSVLSVWMKSTVLDTDTYVSTVAPLANNSDVQNAIATRVTNTLVVDNTAWSPSSSKSSIVFRKREIRRTEDQRRARVGRARRNAEARAVRSVRHAVEGSEPARPHPNRGAARGQEDQERRNEERRGRARHRSDRRRR